jgi:hypothetical protein
MNQKLHWLDKFAGGGDVGEKELLNLSKVRYNGGKE